MLKKKIMLYGPYVSEKIIPGAYGGGFGGYTRNMKAYLSHFKSDYFEMYPSFHTIRGQIKLDFFIIRFLIDTFKFTKDILFKKTDAVHIIAQYRSSTSRDFFVCFLSNVLNKPIIYEIKAGVFIEWYESTNTINKSMMKYIIKKANLILVEGKPYIKYIKSKFNKTSYYFPNYVPSAEIPKQVNIKLLNTHIDILFVGYCYKDKGIFELVEGCNLAAQNNVQINLSIIGHEHESFSKWMNTLTISKNLTIKRLGKKPHKEVINYFDKNDIYCYPTSHKSEGHNNTINEAMMMGLIIITTKKGFLGTVLDNSSAFFLKKINENEIAENIIYINKNRELAREKAEKAHGFLKSNYSSEIAYRKLEKYYRNLFD